MDEQGFNAWLRRCAKTIHADQHLGCRHSEDTILMGPVSDVVHCYCAEDGCNGASGVSVRHYVPIVSSLIAAARVFS